MKYILYFTFALSSPTLLAGIPPKVTVVGRFKSMDKSAIVIEAPGGQIRVPRKSVAAKKIFTGDRVVARVPVKEFLDLNKKK